MIDSEVPTFNSPVDVGLRTLTVLVASFPQALALDRLVVFDYFVVHSDDLPQGPPSLHPRTPYRSGEIAVRRSLIADGLRLFESRALIENRYASEGIRYAASELAGAFLDTLESSYALDLRERAEWVVEIYLERSLKDLRSWVTDQMGEWGAEFEMDSVLWADQ